MTEREISDAKIILENCKGKEWLCNETGTEKSKLLFFETKKVTDLPVDADVERTNQSFLPIVNTIMCNFENRKRLSFPIFKRINKI